jgi:HK97 family phage portal protein
MTQQQLEASTIPYYGEWAALGIPAAWRCATLVSDSVAGLPLFAYLQDATGNEARVDPNPDVLENPSPLLGRHNFFFGVVWSMLLRGDGFAIPADFAPTTGYPRQAVLLNPDEVWIDVDQDTGLPLYHVGDLTLGPGEILHFRGITPPGAYRGVGVIEAHRRGLSTQVSIDNYAKSGFDSSGMPSAIITVDKPELGREQADDVKGRWMAATRGVREPVVIPRTFQFQPIGFSPADLQYIEARKLGATEICWMFGVHPAVIGAPSGGSLTYVNTEAANQAFAQHSMFGWTARIEQTMTMWAPLHYVVRFNYDGFLRATTKERYDAHEVALRIGLETLNEARELEHRAPYDEDFANQPFGGVHAAAEIEQIHQGDAPPELTLIGGVGGTS